MDIDNVLKSEIIQWFNDYIDESEFNEFRISGRIERDPELSGVEIERNKRIHFLINKNLYRGIISYPRMITAWRIQLFDKFSNQEPQDVLRIFKEIVSHGYLKGKMLRWFNYHITKDDLNEFKTIGALGRCSVLHGFERGKERRIDILINKYLYGKSLNYSLVMTNFSKKISIKFQKNHSNDNIIKVFNEIVSYSFLKSEIIQFVDKYINEYDLDRFKIPDSRGRLPKLPGFEKGKERRINILADRDLYEEVLNYRLIMEVLKRRVLNRFKMHYRSDYVEKIFNEVISEIPERIHKYRLKSISKTRRKCNNGLIGLVIFAIIGSFFLSCFFLKRRRR